MSQIKVNEITYEVTKMKSVFDQFHVARKVLPLAEPVIRGYLKLQRDAIGKANGVGQPAVEDPEEVIQQEENLLELFAPVAIDLAKMSRADFDEVLMLCLGCVYRIDPATGTHAPMVSNGHLMFELDLDMMTMIQLVREAMRVNLGPSLRGVLGQYMGAAPANSQ